MGAWDVGPFDNEGAGMLVADLLHGDDLTPALNAIDGVLESEGYLEVYEAQAAIGAAEVMAMVMGAPGNSLPETLLRWRQAHVLTVTAEQVRRASQTVKHVYESSEMRELWEATPDFAAWQAALFDLLARLQGANR